MSSEGTGERLFEAPPEWETLTLGELCARSGGDIQTGPFGSQLHASDYVADGLPSIMPKDLIGGSISTEGIARITDSDAERLARYRVKVGDIVYGRRGDLRRRALVSDREDGWLCGTGCLRVRLEGAADPGWLFSYLGHPRVHEWLERHAVGATMPNLNTQILGDVPLVMPPPDEQRAIASILKALDDKMESNERLRDILVETAAVEWQRLFLNPEGDGLPLGELIEVVRGRSYKSAELQPNDSTALVTLKSIRRGGGYQRGGLKPYVGDYKPTQVVAPGEIVVAHTDLTQDAAVIGRPAIVESDDRFPILIASLDLAIVRPADDRTTREYLYFLLREESFTQHALAYANGSTVLHLSKEALPSFPAVVPSKRDLEQFQNLAQPLLDHARELGKECRTLGATRDSLLIKLVSGELRVGADGMALTSSP